jgi:hypothetical protein
MVDEDLDRLHDQPISVVGQAMAGATGELRSGTR